MFPYDQIIDRYGDAAVFVSSNPLDYDQFPYKQYLQYKKLDTLQDWFTAINSCALFISNLTGPAAIAHALDVPRIIELPDTVDAYHCMGEERFSDNINWYLSPTINTMTL